MVDLPEAFKERMKAQLGADYGAFIRSYGLPPCRGIRVNTLKISVEEFKKISPFALEDVPWEERGFFVESDSPGKTVFHAAGAYYVQEPSAMSAVPELNVCPGERVLDLCAAPGGKGTQIAAYMRGEGYPRAERRASRRKKRRNNVRPAAISFGRIRKLFR